MSDEGSDLGWSWFNVTPPADPKDDALAMAAAACFAGRNGEMLLHHLQATFLDRRLSPSSSDAELRHVEGQRSAIDYLTRLIRRRG